MRLWKGIRSGQMLVAENGRQWPGCSAKMSGFLMRTGIKKDLGLKLNRIKKDLILKLNQIKKDLVLKLNPSNDLKRKKKKNSETYTSDEELLL